MTRSDDFWKFLPTNLVTKVPQIFGNSLGYFKKHHFLGRNDVESFWTTYGKLGRDFIPTSGRIVCSVPTSQLIHLQNEILQNLGSACVSVDYFQHQMPNCHYFWAMLVTPFVTQNISRLLLTPDAKLSFAQKLIFCKLFFSCLSPTLRKFKNYNVQGIRYPILNGLASSLQNLSSTIRMASLAEQSSTSPCQVSHCFHITLEIIKGIIILWYTVWIELIYSLQTNREFGSSWGSVGRVVASDTSYPNQVISEF